MTKERTIERLKRGHDRFREIVSSLGDDRMTKVSVLGKWNVKDVLAHLPAWNWEQAKAIDDLIADRTPWWWGLDEDDFNQREVEKRKDWNMERIVKEWEESFERVILKASELSEEQWKHQVGEKGPDGIPISADSMFAYNYKGEDHEGGHAKEIQEFLKGSANG